MKVWRGIKRRAAVLFYSMRAKVLAACFLSALIASLVATLITYSASVSVIQRNAREQTVAMITAAHKQLDSYAREIENLAVSLAADKENIQKALVNGIKPLNHAWFVEWKAIRQILEQMANSQKAVSRIDIIGQDKLYSTNDMLFASADTQNSWAQYKDLPNAWYHGVNGDGGLSCLRSVWTGREKTGVIRIWFDMAVVQGLFQEDMFPLGHVFILTSQGHFLFGSQAGQQSILASAYAGAFDPALQNEKVSIAGQTYLIIRLESATTGLITLALIDNAELLRDSMHIRRLVTTILLILVGLSLLSSGLVSDRIIKNLRLLEDAMLRVEAGDLSIQLNIPGRNEVARLGRVFQTMMQRIQDLFARVSEKERERHLAELRALQAQIGPHFICNTLSSIKYLAALQDARNIEELAQALAEMMRVTLGSIQDDIPVEEEIAFLRNYVLIQKYRVLDRIEVDFQVDDRALRALVPKLIMQPILENAYLHGFSSSDEGVIAVRVRVEEDLLICEIADNGRGVTPGQMERMLSSDCARPDRAMSGMGISNVRQRLTLRWPGTGRMEIDSRLGEFTCVRLIMPLSYGLQDEEVAPHAYFDC